MHPIVRDEQDLLGKVSTLLAEHPYEAPPREDDLVAELVRLREEIPASKVEDQPALLDQYHQNVSTLEQLRASRDAPKVDPDSPYFAHLRLVENGKARDICLGRATRIEAGVRIIDWRNAPISKLFYRYAQGDDYEEEMAGRTVRGEVAARRTVVIKNQELLRIEAPEGRYELRGDQWIEVPRESMRLVGGAGAALRAHAVGEGGRRRLGTDLEGSRRRADKHLPDVAGLLDPEQFALITKPSTGLVVVRGSAGSGKTTVALHRIAWLAYDDREIDSDRTMFVVFSPALRDYVSHVLPALGVERVRVVAFREWATEMRRRMMPSLPRTVREDTPTAVVKVKLHPGFTNALEDHIRNTRKAPTLESVIDDWASVLTRSELLEPFLGGDFSEADLQKVARWGRERYDEIISMLEGEGGKPQLDEEDDALLLFAWQRRVGPLKSKSGTVLKLRHLAIDEVQDLSPVEVRVLLDCLDERKSVTLAGDTQQHVAKDGGFTSWAEFFKTLGIEGTTVDTLKISYRCSREVMTFANGLLGDLREDDGPQITTRSGPPVELFEFTDHGACVAFLGEVLDSLMHEEPLASVAIVTPAGDVSRLYYRGLQQADVPRLRLVENSAFTFAPGVEVTEIEATKGLEFDYVIIVDANAMRFPDIPEARRHLHVAATRAVHQLWVCTVGSPSPLVRYALAPESAP